MIATFHPQHPHHRLVSAAGVPLGDGAGARPVCRWCPARWSASPQSALFSATCTADARVRHDIDRRSDRLLDLSVRAVALRRRYPTRPATGSTRFWPTIRLGVLTSVVGFSTLLLSGFPGLAQLGLYSITGLITAAAVTRFVLPQLLPAGFVIRDVSASAARIAALIDATPRMCAGQ